MLDELLAVPLPDGFTSARRDRYDAVIDHTFRDTTISTTSLDVATFAYGKPGAYAAIGVDVDDSYTVGIFITATS
ncbi:hypothetical protein [Dactylosporangium sp. NPDC049140]|uniref:hypothetical protein n=1 Tax=Dactylosporangium sp. NPDC049140 TaxID=3155647 RepID=UPI0033CCE5BB